MREADTNEDMHTLALGALAWTLGEPRRAEGHEPDLIACAGALGVAPERLVAARRALEAV